MHRSMSRVAVVTGGTGWNALPVTGAAGMGRPSTEGRRVEVTMKKQAIRLLVVLAASTGVLALVGDSAYAVLTANHCEPVR
jgi:hypothetical protein